MPQRGRIPSPDGVSCLACPPGSTARDPGSQNCVQCLVNCDRSSKKCWSLTSAFSFAFCFYCQPGFFSADAGSSACTQCLPGKSASSSGRYVCFCRQPVEIEPLRFVCDVGQHGMYQLLTRPVLLPARYCTVLHVCCRNSSTTGYERVVSVRALLTRCSSRRDSLRAKCARKALHRRRLAHNTVALANRALLPANPVPLSAGSVHAVSCHLAFARPCLGHSAGRHVQR